MNRQQAEQYLGIAKPTKVRQRYPMINRETPSHWRKTLRVWASLVLGLILGGIAAGMIAGMVQRIWP